jgi:uncharacterized delta-60 repeat protein
VGRARAARAVCVVTVVLSVTATLLAPAASAATAPAGAAGALDTSFGTGGIATLALPGSLTQITKMLLQPDGKIVVAGLQAGTKNSVTVARLNANGSPDTAFNNNTGYSKPGVGAACSPDGASIALQPDGKIIVAGADDDASDVAVMRLNANGTTDTSFGVQGLARKQLSTKSCDGVRGTGIVVLPDGKILVSANGPNGTSKLAVLRFTASGALDSTFGSGGVATPTTTGQAKAEGLAVTGDGKIVVVGNLKNSTNLDTVVARLNANGSADPSFPAPGSSNGVAIFDLGTGSTDAPAAVTIDSHGRIIVTGTVSTTVSTAYVLRLSSTGNLDGTFGTNGVFRSTFSLASASAGAGSAVDANGRLLVAGGDGPSNSTSNALGIERLVQSGTTPYDSSFGLSGTPGRETISCATGQSGAGTSVVVQPNQQVLVGGHCGGALKVARLNSANISNLTMSTSTPAAAAGHPVVPLASIPSNVLAASAGLLSGSELRGSPIFGAPFGHSPFGHSPFGSSPFGNSPFGHSPFGSSPFGSSPFGSSPFGSSPFGSSPFGSSSLSDIPLLPPKTWEQVLVGTPCASIPVQSLTTEYVVANCAAALANVTLNDIQINATIYRNVSLAAFALGYTPFARLPSPCTYISSQPATCANQDANATSLLDLELRGDDLKQYYSSVTINLNGLQLVNSPLPQVWLTDIIRMSDTSLGGVLVSALQTKSTFVTCGNSCPAGLTLGQAQTNGQLVSGPGATLGALLADSPAAVGTLPLQTLLLGMMPREALPVEQLSASSIVAASPLPATGDAAYKIDFDLGCGAAGGLTVRPALPAGFRTVPSTVTMSVGGVNKAVTVATDGAITPQSPITCSGVQHVVVNVGAEPTATLGGPLTAGVTVSNSFESLSIANQAPVTVVDRTNANPATAGTPAGTPTSTDTMYVDHIGRPGNVDYFTIPAQPANSAIIVTLSNIPTGADFDLTLYGNAPSSLRGAPFGSSPFGSSPFGSSPFGSSALLASDDALSPSNDGSSTPPEVLEDVPLIADQPVRSVSAQRGRTDEAVYTITTEDDTDPFTVQVSGFNGSSSLDPYIVRVTVISPSQTLPCATRSYPNRGSVGQIPTNIDPNTRTLILVNKKRLGDVYDQPLADQVMAKLSALAGYVDPSGNNEFDVRGLVVPVDGNAAVRSDYQAWDANPCSVSAANQIVTDVNALVDGLRAGLNDLRYVVIVGSDELIPFGRVPDRSAKANEASYGGDVAARGKDNATSSSLSSGFLLSDNPYGDLNPFTFGATPLYVPQLSVGRLVETPGDIIAGIDQYIATQGIRTPNASYNAAYDWMKATGQAVSAALDPRVPSGTATTNFSDTSTRQDLKSALQIAAHGFVSINAHSNFAEALPAADFTSRTLSPNILSTADLPADLSNGVMLTLGCHTGLNVSDTFIANPNAQEQAALLDWSQAVLRNGGVFQGPTSYGIGDTEVLAYSSRLLKMYAEKLDGTSSIGQALMLAKQQYLQLGVQSVYDAKAIEVATLYGLPMYRLGASGTVIGATLPPLASGPPPPESSATTSASFSTPLTRVDAPDGSGSYLKVGNEDPQVTPNEPIVARTVIPLTPPSPGLVAKDAVPEQMRTRENPGWNPIYSAVDAASGGIAVEPKVRVAAYPSRQQDVVARIAPGGMRQDLVVLASHFATDSSGTGTGNMRETLSTTLTVNWSNNPDNERPDITTARSSINGTTATFVMCTRATDVARGVLLYLPTASTAAQDWVHVEMVDTGGGCWTGTSAVAAGTTNIPQYNGYFCDTAGNCGHTSNKAFNYSTSASASPFSFAVSPVARPNGLFNDPTNVTVNGAQGVTFTVSLDGGAPRSCTTSCVVTVTGDGDHYITATAPDGFTAQAAIPIARPPIVTVSAPTPSSRHRQGQVEPTSFTCSSNVALRACDGPAVLDTSRTGNQTATFSATDQFGQRTEVSVPYYVDGTAPVFSFNQTPPVITNNGQATFTFSATDPDEPGYAVTFTCSLDNATAASCPATTTVTVPAPIDGTHTFTVVASDRVGNTTTEAFTWRIDSTAPVFRSFIGPADPTNQTSAVFAYSADDPPDTAALTFACTLDGATVPCTSTGSTITGLAPRAAPYVFKVTATDPAGNQQSVTHSWRVFQDTKVVATPVVPSVPTLTARLTTATDAPIAGQKLFFTHGQSAGGPAVLCSGSSDGSAITDANGFATCNAGLSGVAAVVLAGGFRATFNSTPPYFGSSGSAGTL